MTYHIVLLPGDGIGPEVMDAAILTLDAVAAACGVSLQYDSHVAGAERYRQTGEAISAATINACLAADAILLAAIGLPDVRLPDNTEIQPVMMMGLRRALGVYAAVRPIRLYAGAPTPLKSTAAGIDFVILRENLEGLFASFGGGCLLEDDVATDTLIMTRKGVERIVKFAFALSAKRNGRPRDGQRVVTCVDKANIFRSYAFFRKIFFEIASQHPKIQAEATYVDAASMLLLQAPENYDVLVMENQFGDILSDLGAGLVGGLGLAPSAEVGEKHGLFQPSHGTAPTLAGKNIANPLAMILSAAMMLDWLGERHSDPAATTAAKRLEAAVEFVLSTATTLTPDLGGTSGTQDVARAVVNAIQ